MVIFVPPVLVPFGFRNQPGLIDPAAPPRYLANPSIANVRIFGGTMGAGSAGAPPRPTPGAPPEAPAAVGVPGPPAAPAPAGAGGATTTPRRPSTVTYCLPSTM